MRCFPNRYRQGPAQRFLFSIHNHQKKKKDDILVFIILYLARTLKGRTLKGNIKHSLFCRSRKDSVLPHPRLPSAFYRPFVYSRCKLVGNSNIYPRSATSGSYPNVPPKEMPVLMDWTAHPAAFLRIVQYNNLESQQSGLSTFFWT